MILVRNKDGILLLCLCGFVLSLSFQTPSLGWLVGWYTHLGSTHPNTRASSFNPTRPLDPQALSYLGLYYINHTLDCTHKKNSLLWKACPILAATIHLWLWLSHHPSHIPPAHSSGSSCTVGSTFCFDCWPCLLVHCQGIPFSAGWVACLTCTPNASQVDSIMDSNACTCG